jgi:acetyl-CoA hydrolase
MDRPTNKLDVVFVEATEVLEDGSIVLGASVGSTPALIQQADKIIIEVNTFLHSFKGLHDLVKMDSPPNRKPLLINRVNDRIGSFSLPIDHEKVLAVVESTRPDNTTANDPQDDVSKAIAQHILNFFEHEVKHDRLPPSLLPLQSGIGNISNAIVGGMATGPFNDVTVWTEVLQDTFLDFFDEGKLKFVSATSIRLSQKGFERFYSHWSNYCDKIGCHCNEHTSRI